MYVKIKKREEKVNGFFFFSLCRLFVVFFGGEKGEELFYIAQVFWGEAEKQEATLERERERGNSTPFALVSFSHAASLGASIFHN